MPRAKLYLVALRGVSAPSSDASCISFLYSAAPSQIVWAARVLGPIVPCTKLDVRTLMETTWDLAIISLHPLPPALDERIASSFKLILDIPQETLDVYSKWNARIQTVHADFPRVRPFTVPTTMPPDSRNLKISQLLLDFGTSLSTSYTGPVSQLNLLSFFPTPEARGLYAQYGKETATAGGRHGGRAKLGGSVLVDEHGNKAAKDGEGWDTIGIAQFPSIWHWIDMAGDPGYQEVNDRCRLTALFDTTIISTRDFDLVALGLAKKWEPPSGKI